jgi:hypothetical protein
VAVAVRTTLIRCSRPANTGGCDADPGRYGLVVFTLATSSIAFDTWGDVSNSIGWLGDAEPPASNVLDDDGA